MKNQHSNFNESEVIHEIKHYLPAQTPLKDFVHHNTLHGFQNMKFHEALRKANQLFGYKTYFSINEFRQYYANKKINDQILNKVIIERKGINQFEEWKQKLLLKKIDKQIVPRVGQLRSNWKWQYKVDLDSLVYPILFRILCNYLDQGISIWNFPVNASGFLESIRELEKNSYISIFKTKRTKTLLLDSTINIKKLLKMIVGDDESLYKQYLFDQQFAHQGWSGIVSSIEDFPQGLLDTKKISVHELIIVELLLEIDALDYHFRHSKNKWEPLDKHLKHHLTEIFSDIPKTELSEVLSIWQDAFEWTYYDEVISGIQLKTEYKELGIQKSFQALFCIDDRECSLRRYLEKLDPNCETFGTPGFFSMEFFYQPEHGKFYTKACPAPVTPKYLIKEVGRKTHRKKDVHFTRQTHTLFRGWLISQTIGFWSAFKLFINIFRPSEGPASAVSFKHMDKMSMLTIENKNPNDKENDLQIGFTIEEMAQRIEGMLRSIGLIKDFAPIIYIIGHGSSSVNNPYYAAYDCGACAGRPGSVNARVFCYMANHPEVRKILTNKGINIPTETQFVGGLHDTASDDISFYDKKSLNPQNSDRHKKYKSIFIKALDFNAKERARRFTSIDTKSGLKQIHEKIRLRTVSLFEPRPELNHATNCLCIVGSRQLTKNVFLDRRAFLNSYDYRIDPDGEYLLNILKPAAPVCGGINLEYFFSRVDNQKLGAGTKLPHNIMGLFGVANGSDGDLRPGLPVQMIEIHDPLRLLMIIEHFPEVVLTTIKKSPETYEWFLNEWVNLVVIHPESHEAYVYKNEAFIKYTCITQKVDTTDDIISTIESEEENLPVYLLK